MLETCVIFKILFKTSYTCPVGMAFIKPSFCRALVYRAPLPTGQDPGTMDKSEPVF